MKDVENAPHEGKRRVVLFSIVFIKISINFPNSDLKYKRMKIIGTYTNYFINVRVIFTTWSTKKINFKRAIRVLPVREVGWPEPDCEM